MTTGLCHFSRFDVTQHGGSTLLVLRSTLRAFLGAVLVVLALMLFGD